MNYIYICVYIYIYIYIYTHIYKFAKLILEENKINTKIYKEKKVDIQL